MAALGAQLLLLLATLQLCHAGLTSPFVRPLKETPDMPLDADVFQPPPGFNSPQQVHIAQGDLYGKAVVISWITPYLPGSPFLYYGTDSQNYDYNATATVTRYMAFNYTSGYIHHCRIEDLEYNTTYFYKLREGDFSREFSFVTPPEVGPDVPYTFGLIGDLGQTADSNATFQHYLLTNGQAVLFVGDFTYADRYPFFDNNRWDTWGRFVEPSMAFQPWIWTSGNHDIECDPSFGEIVPFKAVEHRFTTPHTFSNSTSPLWYSVQRGPAYIIVLSSYSSFIKYSPQYQWLELELAKVDRTKTPWLIVVMHVSFFSSNSVHFMEGDSMRNVFGAWFSNYKVDVVFSGHVHAYERTYRVSTFVNNSSSAASETVFDEDAPAYIVIGDGGNMEGLAGPYMDPQPEYSAFRESSFGHGLLDIKNRTHAFFSWHRNQDGEAVMADFYWLNNQYWKSESHSSA